MPYVTNTAVLKEAGLWKSDDYDNSPIDDEDVTGFVEEASEWIGLELEGVTTISDPAPATVRKIARFYAAGLLMSREYGLEVITEESTKEGKRKIEQAEAWMAEYRARFADNTSNTDGFNIPRSTPDQRLFQTFDPGSNRWEAPMSEGIRVQRKP